jgi:hypothetical protein
MRSSVVIWSDFAPKIHGLDMQKIFSPHLSVVVTNMDFSGDLELSLWTRASIPTDHNST